MAGWITTWWKRTFEGLRGAFVSPRFTLFCAFPWSMVVGLVLVAWLVFGLCFLLFSRLSGELAQLISF